MSTSTLIHPRTEMDLLRFTTAGSVDDGKSTLIGRLLYDTKSIFQDQLEAIEHASRRRGDEGINLALLTDGLRAEREQNITIDVAYRYFATPRRKFIIADTPGHLQYTRNMVTGASTAELAIVLVDARKGVLTQSRRHGFISSLLRIPHILVAVNKMDLVDYREDVFNEIVAEYRDFAERLEMPDIVFIPISALEGDNVVEKSTRMPWYDGATLLHHLETVNVGAHRNLVDFRFAVQYVVRPHQDFRGFAGRIASGAIRPGEEVVVLPSGQASRIHSIETASGPMDEALAGDSVVLTIEDEVDVSRGAMIVRKLNVPTVANRVDAMLCWMGEQPLDCNTHYLLMHTSRQVKAFVSRVVYQLHVDTLQRMEVDTLGLNDIGRVEITTAEPLLFDPYQRNHDTGSFILIDPFTHVTVAAGMIRSEVRRADELFAAPEPEVVQHPNGNGSSPHVVWEAWNVPREEREARNGHPAAVLWFTGLSGAGKSTIARLVEQRLYRDHGCQTMLLDGDQLRHGLCGDLGFSQVERQENLRRVREAARLFFEQGSLVLCTLVSPYREDRGLARKLLPEGRFLEIHVEADLDTCRARDPKGLYAKAERGEIPNFTGVSAPYEAPDAPELVLDTRTLTAAEAAEQVIDFMRATGLLPRSRPMLLP